MQVLKIKIQFFTQQNLMSSVQGQQPLMFSVHSNQSDWGNCQTIELSETQEKLTTSDKMKAQVEFDNANLNRSQGSQIKKGKHTDMQDIVSDSNSKPSQALSEIKRIILSKGSQNQILKQEIQILKIENQSLKQMKQTIDQLSQINKFDELQKKASQRDEFKSLHKQLSQEVQKQKDHIVLIQNSIEQFKTMEKEYEQSIERIQKSSDQKILLLEKEVAQLKIEIDQQKNQKRTLNIDNQQLREQVNTLKKNLKDKQINIQEFKQLTQCIQIKNQQVSIQSSKIQDLSKSVRDSEQMQISLTWKIKMLETEKICLQKHCNDLQLELSQQKKDLELSQHEKSQALKINEDYKGQIDKINWQKQTLSRQIDKINWQKQTLSGQIRQAQLVAQSKYLSLQDQLLEIRKQAEYTKQKLLLAEQAQGMEYNRAFNDIQQAFRFINNTLTAIEDTVLNQTQQELQKAEILRRQESRKNTFRNLLIGYLKGNVTTSFTPISEKKIEINKNLIDQST